MNIPPPGTPRPTLSDIQDKENKNPSQVKSAKKRFTPPSLEALTTPLKSIKSRLVRLASPINIATTSSPGKTAVALKEKINTFVSEIAIGSYKAGSLKEIGSIAKKIAVGGSSPEQIINEELNICLGQTSLEDMLTLNKNLSQKWPVLNPKERQILDIFCAQINGHLKEILADTPPFTVTKQLLPSELALVQKALSAELATESKIDSVATSASKGPSINHGISHACWKDLGRATFTYIDKDNQLQILCENTQDNSKIEAIKKWLDLADQDADLMLRSSNQAHQGVFAPLLEMFQSNGMLNSFIELPDATLGINDEGEYGLIPKGTAYLPRGGEESVTYTLSSNKEAGIKIQADFTRTKNNRYSGEGMEAADNSFAINPESSVLAIQLEINIPKNGSFTLESATVNLTVDFTKPNQSHSSSSTESKAPA